MVGSKRKKNSMENILTVWEHSTRLETSLPTVCVQRQGLSTALFVCISL